MKKISAIITTFNNARTIEQVLVPLQWCDEIIVVDSGSSDATISICKKYNCKIIHHEFEGFGRQKNFAVQQAKNNWVWVVDADEVASAEICDEINKRVGKEKYNAYMVPISLVFLGKLLRFGGEYKKTHLRLFNKNEGGYNSNEVHEDVMMTSGKKGVLKGNVLHYSYNNMEHFIAKMNLYSTRAAEKMYSRNKKKNIAVAFIECCFHFVWNYIFKGLFLDGYAGLVWAEYGAESRFAKYSKLYELNKNKNGYK